MAERLTKQEQKELADKIFDLLREKKELPEEVWTKAKARVVEKIDRDG